MAERRRGTRVPHRWWEQSGIDWKLAREKEERAEAIAEHAGAHAEEMETPGSGTGAGEEASLGAVAPAGKNGARRRIEAAHSNGRILKQST